LPVTVWATLLCPKPGADHSAPFQPSPYESVMVSTHSAPITTVNSPTYGAPALSVVPSSQVRLQPTSYAYEPAETVIAESEAGGGVDGVGEGGEGGSSGDGGGEGGLGGGKGLGGGGDGDGGGGEGGDGGGGEGGTQLLQMGFEQSVEPPPWQV
jgi:hypothetical protein